jgi:2-keto-4-pentenoate hydratase/2-oxohepta-3-ene-1,7-dioic acid hydratase in catechol pathway
MEGRHMRIARTPQGLGRLVDDRLELLDLPGATIADAVRLGTAALTETAVLQTIPVGGVELLAPVDPLPRFGLVGANYASHIAEAKMATPQCSLTLMVPGERIVLTGPRADIVLPAEAAGAVDYEGELAVLLMQEANKVTPDEAWECIAGFMALNDVSARDVQLGWDENEEPAARIARVMRAKSFPTFKPCGPGLLLRETVERDTTFEIVTTVNGAVRQSASTDEMLFDVAVIVSEASRYEPIAAGTLITTGTPAGVGFVSGNYLRPGDVVEVMLSGIGTLCNRVVAGATS